MTLRWSFATSSYSSRFCAGRSCRPRLALRTFDLAREHLALDHLAFLHARGLQPALGAVRVAEDAHQVVFERQVEAARARVAWRPNGRAAGCRCGAIVPLCADDVQAARRDHRSWRVCHSDSTALRAASSARSSCASSTLRLPPSTMSVPAAGHVGGDRHRTGRPACATMCASRSCCLAFSTRARWRVS